jgi:hypothetical protein
MAGAASGSVDCRVSCGLQESSTAVTTERLARLAWRTTGGTRQPQGVAALRTKLSALAIVVPALGAAHRLPDQSQRLLLAPCSTRAPLKALPTRCPEGSLRPPRRFAVTPRVLAFDRLGREHLVAPEPVEDSGVGTGSRSFGQATTCSTVHLYQFRRTLQYLPSQFSRYSEIV